MGIEYFGENANRKLKADGKHSLNKVETDTSIIITCRGCEFKASAPKLLNDLVIAAEKAGHMHITEPDLLVSGSSDISYAMRMAMLNRGRHAG